MTAQQVPDYIRRAVVSETKGKTNTCWETCGKIWHTNDYRKTLVVIGQSSLIPPIHVRERLQNLCNLVVRFMVAVSTAWCTRICSPAAIIKKRQVARIRRGHAKQSSWESLRMMTAAFWTIFIRVEFTLAYTTYPQHLWLFHRAVSIRRNPLVVRSVLTQWIWYCGRFGTIRTDHTGFENVLWKTGAPQTVT